MRKSVALFICLLAAAELRGASQIRSVLVFPFENRSSRSDLNWISESFAEVLSTRLESPGRSVLGRSERKEAYDQLGIPANSPLTLASAYKVAEVLGADWGVVGDFNVEGDRLSARARVLDLRTVKLAPPLEAAGQLADLVELQTRLAWRILALHDPGFTTGKEEDFVRRFPEIRLDAFESYIRGVLATDDSSRVSFLTEADRLNPAEHRAAFELGRHFFQQKDYAASAKWSRRLNETDADYFESLFYLSVDEFFLGRDAEAEKGFEALAKEVPLNEVWNNLGVMLARRGRHAEALVSFERAYQRDPSDPDFCFNRAVSLWYMKRYDQAAGALKEALRANPEDSEAHTLLATVLGRLVDSTGEQRELQWLAEREGNSPADVLGDFLPQARLKKNYEGRAFRLLTVTVRNALEQRLAEGPAEQHRQAHLARGRQFLVEGRIAEAERELAEAASLLPQDSEAHLALAQALEVQGRQQEAARELEASLKLKNTSAAHLHLARVYLSLGRPEAAREHSQAALSLDPANREAEGLVEAVKAAQRVSATRKTP